MPCIYVEISRQKECQENPKKITPIFQYLFGALLGPEDGSEGACLPVHRPHQVGILLGGGELGRVRVEEVVHNIWGQSFRVSTIIFLDIAVTFSCHKCYNHVNMWHVLTSCHLPKKLICVRKLWEASESWREDSSSVNSSPLISSSSLCCVSATRDSFLVGTRY